MSRHFQTQHGWIKLEPGKHYEWRLDTDEPRLITWNVAAEVGSPCFEHGWEGYDVYARRIQD